MSANGFDICLPHVLAEECLDPAHWSSARNYSDDPRDRGGATMCGIIQREYDHFRKVQGEHTQPVRLITEAEGKMIYLHWYWLPHCPDLPSGLDLSFFDSAVNQGSTEAIRILQVALGVEEDGIWGPKTATAVESTPAAVAVSQFAMRRHLVYEESHGFKTFGVDWVRRTNNIERASLAMVQTSVAV